MLNVRGNRYVSSDWMLHNVHMCWNIMVTHKYLQLCQLKIKIANVTNTNLKIKNGN